MYDSIANPPPIDPDHVEWFKKTLTLLNVPGVWAVPRSMLIVHKTEEDLVEIKRMEGDDLPELLPEWAEDPDYWAEFQIFDAFQITRHSELAGFRVINHLASASDRSKNLDQKEN